MGEFLTGSGDTHTPENVTMGSSDVADGGDNSQSGFETDVADVRADDVIKQGKDEFPCFDVDQGEFYQNMQDGRRRLRFKSGSNAQQYMSKTKYNRPFFIRHTDDDGKKYIRRVK